MSNVKRPLIITVSILVIAAGAVGAYLLAGRQTTDYSAAAKHLQNLSVTTSAISDTADTIILSADITEDAVTSLEASSKQYGSELANLAKSAAVTQDATVGATYDKHKAALAEYGRSVEQLVESLKKYRSILTACTDLVDKIGTLSTAKGFDTAATDCTAAVDAAKSAPYKPFNDQFLRQYVTLAGNLLGAHRQVVVQAEAGANTVSLADINAAKDKITALGSDSNLHLAPAANPSEPLRQLTTAVDTRKTALF